MLDILICHLAETLSFISHPAEMKLPFFKQCNIEKVSTIFISHAEENKARTQDTCARLCQTSELVTYMHNTTPFLLFFLSVLKELEGKTEGKKNMI